VVRKAQAAGKIFFSPKTLEEVRRAGSRRATRFRWRRSPHERSQADPLLIPHCSSDFLWIRSGWILTCVPTVSRLSVTSAPGEAGVEMGSLVGVSMA